MLSNAGEWEERCELSDCQTATEHIQTQDHNNLSQELASSTPTQPWPTKHKDPLTLLMALRRIFETTVA